MAVFDLLKCAKIDFTKNQRGRKIAKSTQCVEQILLYKGFLIPFFQSTWVFCPPAKEFENSELK